MSRVRRELDLSQPIRRPSDQRRLIEGILDGSLGVDETTWLEWKSRVDWRNDAEIATNVARHIIGFANRDPDEAQAFVGGDAYLVIGPDEASGTRIDPADIENKLSPYLGEDGPGWSLSHVEVDGRTSLLITVAPPRAGGDIHALAKDAGKYFDGRETGKYLNGTVFVRRKGKTEQATRGDIRRLQLRAEASTSQIAIEVGVRPDTLKRLSLEKDIGAYLQAERDRLLGPLALEEARVGGGQSGVLESLMGQGQRDVLEKFVSSSFAAYRERRKPSEFRTQCETYLRDVEGLLKDSAHHMAARRGLGGVEVHLTNPGARNLLGVEVELLIPAEVLASRGRADGPDDMPDRPMPWGQDTFMTEIAKPIWKVPGSLLSPGMSPRVWHLKSANGVRFDDVDLRPYQNRVLPPVHLFWIGPSANGTVELQWRATAQNTDDRAEGVLTFRIDDSVLTLSDLLGAPVGRS
ncbi:MAG TPA: hypothetical protein VN973_06050 [Candidatus Dormibacteraeota bacterium]|nr:hypothetical protein [Candidatus Dormibacteraeota bacterium]